MINEENETSNLGLDPDCGPPAAHRPWTWKSSYYENPAEWELDFEKAGRNEARMIVDYHRRRLWILVWNVVAPEGGIAEEILVGFVIRKGSLI